MRSFKSSADIKNGILKYILNSRENQHNTPLERLLPGIVVQNKDDLASYNERLKGLKARFELQQIKDRSSFETVAMKLYSKTNPPGQKKELPRTPSPAVTQEEPPDRWNTEFRGLNFDPASILGAMVYAGRGVINSVNTLLSPSIVVPYYAFAPVFKF